MVRGSVPSLITLQALDAVSAAWLSPTTSWRPDAIDALSVSTGYQPRLIERAIENAFSVLRLEHLRELPAAEQSLVTLHVLPANVFTAGLPGIYTALGMGHFCALKPSRSELVFTNLLISSFMRIAPALAARLNRVDWTKEVLQETDIVIAFGSDDTLATLKAQIPPKTRFVGYGHKLSVAVIQEEALTSAQSDQTLNNLIADAELFDLQGCLSPQIVFIQDNIPPGWEEKLRRHCARIPELRTFKQWQDVQCVLQPLVPHLSALGYAGSAGWKQSHQSDWERLGFSRICHLGEMQRPPLSWPNGGMAISEILVR